MTTLHIDIETRSRQNLKAVGVYRYSECPDFSILMAAWSLDGSPIRVAQGHDEINEIPGLWDDSVRKVAHNAQFERVCFSRLAGGDWQDPQPWDDTMARAAEWGYPRSLDGLAKALKCAPKDEAGKALINLFCKPRKDGGWADASTHPAEWLDFMLYCAQDVEALAEVDAKLPDWPTEMERRVWAADQRVNDAGMPVDLPMAALAHAQSLDNIRRMKDEAFKASRIQNANSVQQVRKWWGGTQLLTDAPDLPNLQAKTVEELLAGELPPAHRQVLELRQELALAAASKYAAALACSSGDSLVRGSFRFYGAHTGRWSGRGIQPQNLPRAAFETEEEAGKAIARLTDPKQGDPPLSQLDLKKLVRPLFEGPFTVVDYASIEARVVAWLAGEEWALQAFRDGRDIYVETAERMGGMTRAQGKIAVLALGYNGGVGSLRAMGYGGKPRSGDTKAAVNADGSPYDSGSVGAALDASSSGEYLSDDILRAMVNTWRKANPRIVSLWRTMQDATDGGGWVGRHIRVRRMGSTMLMDLPSGRSLVYRDFRYESYAVIDKKTGAKSIKTSLRYSDPGAAGRRIATYGGKLVENATQAVARDILAEALVRLHDRGYTVAGHVHDEIIVRGEHDVDTINKIMCEPPTWAAGLPIDGEGFTCERYRKG